MTEPILAGTRPRLDPIVVEPADAAGLAAHRRLRQVAFVERQGLFPEHDLDEADGDAGTVVLVARDATTGAVLGGVRLAPHEGHHGIGWWRGSRLVVAPGAGLGVGSRLVRAAAALAQSLGALRFDATVQVGKAAYMARLGWVALDAVEAAGHPHVLMVAPSDRFERPLADHKVPLGRLLEGLRPGGAGFVGDDAAPVPGCDLVAACDAVSPSMVARDPVWAGWCSVLVNLNDLAAMGAAPVGLLDAVAGPDEAHVGAVLDGLRAAAAAYGVPILGGHTQLGEYAAATVTALGRTSRPVPGGGGRPGDQVRLVADLAGGWRPGYTGRQWDSTTHRSPGELRHLVGLLGRCRPAAAKDVSMAGAVGTLAMLAEAGGTGAEVDVAAVPHPAGAGLADWLTCFPGFALLTADRPGVPLPEAAPATAATIGRLVPEPGVRLRWPDGLTTPAVAGPATGLGRS